MPKKKKSKKKVPANSPHAGDGVPRSFIIAQKTSPKVDELVANFRMMMSPYTALKLKVRKKNVLKDFVHMAAPFGVTHLVVFNKTDVGTNMRIARMPRGPTLTFRVNSFALMRDVVNSQSKPKSFGSQFDRSALLVLNNFGGDDVATKLVTRTFQNMLPSIDVSTIQLKQLRRVILLHNDPEDDVIYLRHYEITVRPTGLSKSVKRLLKTEIPDLKNFESISDYILRGGEGYESDGSDVETANKVMLAQTVRGSGTTAGSQSAVRLVELGPRLQLQLLKIQDGFNDGEVLFHKFKSKTDAEVGAIEKKREKARLLKAKRKAEQERNVKRKRAEKDAHKERSMGGKKGGGGGPADPNGFDAGSDSDADVEDPEADGEMSDDDDVAYYREAVGEEPESDLFRKPAKKAGGRGGGRGRGRGGRGRGRGGGRGGGRGEDGGQPAKKGRFNERHPKRK